MATTYIPVIPAEEIYKLTFPATENPQPNGEAAPGVSECWAREDHVHPNTCSLIITDENVDEYVKWDIIDKENNIMGNGPWLEVPSETELIYFNTTQQYENLWGIRPTPGTKFKNFHRITVLEAFFRQNQRGYCAETETETYGTPYGMSIYFYASYVGRAFSQSNYPRFSFIDLIFVENTKTWYSKCY